MSKQHTVQSTSKDPEMTNVKQIKQETNHLIFTTGTELQIRYEVR